MSTDASCPNVCLDPFQMNGFSLHIDAFPDMTYWVKDVNIPSMSLNDMTVETPFSNIPFTGDKIQYGSLEIRVMANADLSNYYDFYKWISLVGFPNNYSEVNQWREMHFNLYPNFKDTDLNLVTDIRLNVNGANSKTVKTIVFKNCVIATLGAIQLTDESSETAYAYFNVSMRFTNFTME